MSETTEESKSQGSATPSGSASIIGRIEKISEDILEIGKEIASLTSTPDDENSVSVIGMSHIVLASQGMNLAQLSLLELAREHHEVIKASLKPQQNAQAMASADTQTPQSNGQS